MGGDPFQKSQTAHFPPIPQKPHAAKQDLVLAIAAFRRHSVCEAVGSQAIKSASLPALHLGKVQIPCSCKPQASLDSLPSCEGQLKEPWVDTATGTLGRLFFLGKRNPYEKAGTYSTGWVQFH